MTTKSDAMEFLEELTGGPITIAEMVESCRLCEEISQAELGRMLGVSRAYINSVEKGRRLVSPAQAARFARAFEMSPEHWISVALQDQLKADGFNFKVLLQTQGRRRRRSGLGRYT